MEKVKKLAPLFLLSVVLDILTAKKTFPTNVQQAAKQVDSMCFVLPFSEALDLFFSDVILFKLENIEKVDIMKSVILFNFTK